MARILVVDDDPLFLTIMSRALENARHEVTAVNDGANAIELFGEAPFDALVCDLVLPAPTGLKVIREARHRAPDVAIIAVSGGKSDGKSVHVDVFNMALAVGASTIVKKPFEVADFVAAVERTLLIGKDKRIAVGN